MLGVLVQRYVESLNSKGISNIENAWTYLCQS